MCSLRDLFEHRFSRFHIGPSFPMQPVDIEPSSDAESSASAVAEINASATSVAAGAPASSSLPEVHSAIEGAASSSGLPSTGVICGGGVAGGATASDIIPSAPTPPLFGGRHRSRQDVGTLSFVVGLTEASADALPRIPWHAIVSARSGPSTAWIATEDDRAPFLTGRLPTEMGIAAAAAVPVFAARESLVDCLRYLGHLEHLDWSVLVVKVLLSQPTCGLEELCVGAIQGHRLASASASPPGLWGRIASTLLEGAARVVSCSCDGELAVLDVATLLAAATAALGVPCRLVVHDVAMRCGIFVLGEHEEIRGATDQRCQPAAKAKPTGPSRTWPPVPARAPRFPAFAVALPRSKCKEVAGGRFLGLMFQTVSRRTPAAVEARSTNAEVRQLRIAGRGGRKRGRGIDNWDL